MTDDFADARAALDMIETQVDLWAQESAGARHLHEAERHLRSVLRSAHSPSLALALRAIDHYKKEEKKDA